jgi:murein DD-endopeptidase MepM/ murein hydrolase activator NlpD
MPNGHTTAQRPRSRRGPLGVTAAVLILLSAIASGLPAQGAWARATPPSADLSSLGWVWPASAFRLARPYVAPAHEYGPGHRGIDLALPEGMPVRAPADGVVAFAGSVAGRGILTIDHGDGLVTTLEPVQSQLAAGTAVRRGEDIAALGAGGHAEAGQLHFGVRLDGSYINPMLLLDGVPRAVLLPCCD